MTQPLAQSRPSQTPRYPSATGLALDLGTIKRHVAGKGNASKESVLAAIRARGFRPADNNEADALACLLWATETNGGLR